MSASPRRNPSCRRFGFTLVELLVVIVIIAMLIGLLLPAFNSSRNSAKRLASQAQLQGLGDACESYSMTFKRYPGFFGPSDIDAMTNKFTDNENFVVALMGYVDDKDNITNANEYNPSSLMPGNYRIDISKIGNGPLERRGKLYAPFYSAKGDELSQLEGLGLGGMDAEMPHLVDVSSGMPLLMWHVGTPGGGKTPVGADVSAGQVSMKAVDLYLKATALKQPDGRGYDQLNSSLFSSTAASSYNLKNLAMALIDKRASVVNSNTTANGTNDVISGAYAFISPSVDGIYFDKFQLDEKGTTTQLANDADVNKLDDVVFVGGSRD